MFTSVLAGQHGATQEKLFWGTWGVRGHCEVRASPPEVSRPLCTPRAAPEGGVGAGSQGAGDASEKHPGNGLEEKRGRSTGNGLKHTLNAKIGRRTRGCAGPLGDRGPGVPRGLHSWRQTCLRPARPRPHPLCAPKANPNVVLLRQQGWKNIAWALLSPLQPLLSAAL